jgi:hypothetical protein
MRVANVVHLVGKRAEEVAATDLLIRPARGEVGRRWPGAEEVADAVDRLVG